MCIIYLTTSWFVLLGSNQGNWDCCSGIESREPTARAKWWDWVFEVFVTFHPALHSVLFPHGSKSTYRVTMSLSQIVNQWLPLSTLCNSNIRIFYLLMTVYCLSVCNSVYVIALYSSNYTLNAHILGSSRFYALCDLSRLVRITVIHGSNNFHLSVLCAFVLGLQLD